jgi:phenylalanyl-tRNA synthetase beta chain
VDITNFIMLLTAQPLHAYDYDKVLSLDHGASTATLVVRLPKKGETLTLLGGKTIEPHKEAILITTGTKAIGLGGVMGGADTEVDNNTKNIILECANFDMYSIRKTSMAHGLFTDAVTRFSKGQSPLQNDRVLAQAIKMMKEIAGAKITSQIIDNKHLRTIKPVSVSPKFINQRLGLKLDANQISRTLKNVEFKVDTKADELIVAAPFWRTDIEIPEDVVEEVGRLTGYDKLPLDLPRRSLKPAATNDLLELKSEIRQILQAAGANEVLTYSFAHGNLLAQAGQNKELAYQLSNALSPDLQYYRLSILPSLLEKVHSNIKTGYGQFALFELGRAHVKGWLDEEKLPKEEQHLALVFAADAKAAKTYAGAPYFEAQKYLAHLLAKLGINPVFSPLPAVAKLKVNQQMLAPFEASRSAMVTDAVSDELLGVAGELKLATKLALKLPEFAAGFEVDVDKILNLKGRMTEYVPLPKFPKVEQDISLKVPANVTFGLMFSFVFDEINKLKPAKTHFELTPLDIYQRPDDKSYKQFAFRLKIASYQKTMKAEEVNELLDAVASAASKKFGAHRL